MSGEHQAAGGPPGQRRPHQEAEGGDRLAEQSESDILSVPFVFSCVGGLWGLEIIDWHFTGDVCDRSVLFAGR